MLEFFREKMQSTFAMILVVFFCAVFSLWGVERVFNGKSGKDAVATVNDYEITEPELANSIQMLRAQYTKMLGGQVDAKFLNDKMLREPALESLISRKLLEDYVEKNKMVVGKATIDKVIVADKTFSRDGKTFDPEYYKERLRESGISAAVYQKHLSTQLVLQHLQSGIASTAFVTDADVQRIARLMAQKRSFEYVVLSLKSFADHVVISDELLDTYYKDHQSDFMSDEQVTIEYLELNKRALADTIKLDETDIRAAYDKEAAAFKPATERSAAHILIESKGDGSHEAKLSEIEAGLKKGEKFEDLAKMFSVDEGSAAQGGDVGFTSGETFVPEFEKALAALVNVGDVSGPVKTEFGYHIIKLTGKRDTSFKSFDDRKADIEKELRSAKAAALYSEKVDALGESTYSAGDLTTPAKEMGLLVQKAAPFTRRGGAAIAGEQKVIEAAFSPELVESGKNSQVIEISGDKAVVLRVVEHTMPKVREMADVKSVVTEKVKNELATAQLQTKTEALKARASNEKALDGIARDEKIDIAPVVAITRKSAKPEQAEIVEAVFKIAKPAEGAVAIDAFKTGAGDWVIVKLNKVEDVTVTPESPEYIEVKERLNKSVGEEEFAVFEKQLQKHAKITRREVKETPESP